MDFLNKIISLSAEGWSAFFAGVAFFISLLALLFSYESARLNRKPVLVFEYDGSRGWILRNVGNGPALNILMAQKVVGGGWFNPVRIPPISKDGEFIPKWLGHVNSTGLGAIYTDSEGAAYTSICGNDLSRIEKGQKFGPWQEDQIGKHWNQSPYKE